MALNCGDTKVPIAKATNGTQRPVKPEYLSNKKRNKINNIAKQPSWYKKARNCNLVMIF